MSLIIWKNNASSTMASSITNVATQVTVQAGQGALFPAPTAGQYAVITLEDVSGNIEIVQCTGRTGDTLTIVRAQEGTTGLAFNSGSRVECRVTAAVLAAMLQKTSDTLADTTISGIVTMGAGGSIRGAGIGEIAGVPLRGAPGATGNQIILPVDGSSNPYIGPTSSNVILTKTNLTSNLPSGYAMNITGMIMFWNSTAGTIPAGYQLCDGTGGSPDLRDQFIVGAGSTFAQGTSGGSSSTTTSTSGATSTGTYALTVADIPAHHHSVPIQILAVGVGGGPNVYISGSSGVITGDTGGGGTHSHSIAQHTHTYTLPPYRAIVAIMKT
jgi:hypothetical protein